MSTDQNKPDLASLRIKRDARDESTPTSSRLVPRLALVGAIIVVVAVGYWLLSSAFNPALEVQLVPVTLTSPSQASAVLTASGYVVAQRKAAVASKATGRLVFLGVVEGDEVKKGQVLARIEDADIRAQLEQARATLRLNEAELNDAERTLARQKTMLESGLTSQAEFDAAEARFQRVVAAIEVARAAVVGAEVALENTLIRAPFDGTVLTKNADVGEMVAPMAASIGSRSAVVTIADMRSLEVEADVSEANIERIVPDQPCEITLDAYPEVRYRGFVAKIVPTADRAKATVTVKVGFRSYDSRVLPEMSAKVLFLGRTDEPANETVKPVATVPLSAVATRVGRTVVFTVEGGKAAERPVTTGQQIGSLVEIREGLAVGERVIARVNEEIRPGIKVVIK
jgi:RND family efflux transporter MFP subunit